MRPSAGKDSAFTLIELLVVIAIIAVLAGMMFPVFGRIKENARMATCTNNLRQIAAALLAYENEFGQMPWLDQGTWTQVKAPNGNLVDSASGANWNEVLRNLKFLPNTPTSGVWRCPSVRQEELLAEDSNGWKANWGGYGVCSSIFRYEQSKSAVFSAALQSSKLPRPSDTWLVGDCGQPQPGSAPGSGLYRRTGSSFSRPGSLGQWVFGTNPSYQPALRHRGVAIWAAFDGRVQRMTWVDMVAERNNFTARGETF